VAILPSLIFVVRDRIYTKQSRQSFNRVQIFFIFLDENNRVIFIYDSIAIIFAN